MNARRLTAATLAWMCTSCAGLAFTGAYTLALPDNRAYELVSTIARTEVYQPPNTGEDSGHSEENEGGPTGMYRAATSGNAVAYMGDPPSSGVTGSGGTGNGDGNHYLASRGANGWEARDIDPHINASLDGITWQALSSDLSLDIFNTNYPVEAIPEAPASCLAESSVTYLYTAGGYRSLNEPGHFCGGRVVGISDDNSRMLMYAHEGEGSTAIYDSIGGNLHRVDVMLDGEPEPSPSATLGGSLSSSPAVSDESLGEELRSNAISADASRIFWTDLNAEATPENPAGAIRLFVRENDSQPQSPLDAEGRCTAPVDACTLQLDVAQTGAEGASGNGRFWTASADGARVFFTDCSRLTADATAISSGGCGERQALTGNDLYEYDFGKASGARLSDLTVDHSATDSLGADVQGVVGATTDGSYVYFVAKGVLSEGANVEGGEPISGEPNLYVRHEDSTTFVATLSPEDNHFHGANESQGYFNGSGDWRGDLGMSDAEVASEGHSVAFMSRLPLTGYDNVLDGERVPEVFLYDASTGRIDCASCNPTGVPPIHVAEGGFEVEWGNKRGGYVTVSDNDQFSTNWVNAEGTRVYFQTNQSLVSQDTNRHQDVYEWESDGAGDCREATGCTRLISAGNTPNDASFVDASTNGDDVFFTSRAKLIPQALGETLELYDARVEGGFPEFSLACTGTGCQGIPPAPPIFATPSSVTFSGVGNFEAPIPAKTVTLRKKTATQVKAEKLSKALKACRKERKKKRTVCERRARKQYAPANKKGKR